MTTLETFAGDELTFEVEVTNEDPLAPAVTLAGADIRAAVYRRSQPPVAVLTLLSGIEVVTLTAPAVFLVRLAPAVTAALAGAYRVEAKVRFPLGRVESVMRADLRVGDSVLGAMP